MGRITFNVQQPAKFFNSGKIANEPSINFLVRLMVCAIDHAARRHSLGDSETVFLMQVWARSALSHLARHFFTAKLMLLNDESDSECKAKRKWSACLSKGCAGARAQAEVPIDQSTLATSLAADFSITATLWHQATGWLKVCWSLACSTVSIWSAHCGLNLLICVVLTEGVNSPYCGRDPPD